MTEEKKSDVKTNEEKPQAGSSPEEKTPESSKTEDSPLNKFKDSKTDKVLETEKSTEENKETSKPDDSEAPSEEELAQKRVDALGKEEDRLRNSIDEMRKEKRKNLDKTTETETGE